MSRQREPGAEGKGGEEEEENRTGLVVVVWYDVLVEGGSTHSTRNIGGGRQRPSGKTLETVIYYRTAFSANSNFFSYPTIFDRQGPATALHP